MDAVTENPGTEKAQDSTGHYADHIFIMDDCDELKPGSSNPTEAESQDVIDEVDEDIAPTFSGAGAPDGGGAALPRVAFEPSCGAGDSEDRVWRWFEEENVFSLIKTYGRAEAVPLPCPTFNMAHGEDDAAAFDEYRCQRSGGRNVTSSDSGYGDEETRSEHPVQLYAPRGGSLEHPAEQCAPSGVRPDDNVHSGASGSSCDSKGLLTARGRLRILRGAMKGAMALGIDSAPELNLEEVARSAAGFDQQSLENLVFAAERYSIIDAVQSPDFSDDYKVDIYSRLATRVVTTQHFLRAVELITPPSSRLRSNNSNNSSDDEEEARRAAQAKPPRDRVATEKRLLPCAFYARGACTRECGYSHDAGLIRAERKRRDLTLDIEPAEKRIDPADLRPYSKAGFIRKYGRKKGTKEWKALRRRPVTPHFFTDSPRGSSLEPAVPSVVHDTPAEVADSWVCGVCSFRNIATARCVMCKLNRRTSDSSDAGGSKETGLETLHIAMMLGFAPNDNEVPSMTASSDAGDNGATCELSGHVFDHNNDYNKLTYVHQQFQVEGLRRAEANLQTAIGALNSAIGVVETGGTTVGLTDVASTEQLLAALRAVAGAESLPPIDRQMLLDLTQHLEGATFDGDGPSAQPAGVIQVAALLAQWKDFGDGLLRTLREARAGPAAEQPAPSCSLSEHPADPCASRGSLLESHAEPRAPGSGRPVMQAVSREASDEVGQLCRDTPIWMRRFEDVTNEEYTSFYRSLSGAWEDHLAMTHFSIECQFQSRALLFVARCEHAVDSFELKRQHNNIKLYINSVFVTDNCDDLLPGWLNMVTGVVDLEDMPLHIPDRTPQQNEILRGIRRSLVEGCLGMFADIADNPSIYIINFTNNLAVTSFSAFARTPPTGRISQNSCVFTPQSREASR